MKRLFLSSSLIISSFNIGFTQPGNTGPSYGRNGIVKTDIGANISYPSTTRQVFTQSDGSIFVLVQSNGIAFIAKKHSYSVPDSTYGTTGFSVAVIVNNVMRLH